MLTSKFWKIWPIGSNFGIWPTSKFDPMKSSIWKFHIWNFNSIYGNFFPYMEFWNSINGIFFPWKNLNFPGMPKTYPKGLGHAKFSLLVPWWVVYGLGNFFSTRLYMKSYISVSLVWPYILGKSGTFNNL